MQFKKRRLKAVVPFRLLTVIFVCAIFNVLSVKGSSKTSFKIEKHAEFGTDIQLPCILKLPQCTDVHSVKWYKGNKRIFLYSTEGDIMLPSHKVALRMSMILPKNNTRISYLKISNLTLDDESLYKCEVTYLLVTHECNNVQYIALNVTVQPTSVRVIDESTKQTLEDGRVLGPIIEGSTIDLRCESGKGKPIPTVEWYNGNVRLTSESSAELEEHEIGTGSGTLNFVVSRNELGATFTCKVNNLALTEPLKIDIKLNVHVRPIKMDIKGVVGHVIQGSKVLLQCEVQAARPPANVTWYNGTKILEKSNSRLDMYETKFADNEDGTTQTNSFLAFTATEHDNGQKFSCLAMNSVMLKEGSKPMKETVIIEVMYRPVVRMNPPNITVNETKDFQLFCDYEANPATLINVIWQRDRKNLNLNENRFEGGTIELTSLLVKNAKSSDMGKYRCILENDLGTSSSQDFIDVSVLFRPIMKVIIEPHVPINEAARVNISLSCNLITGNPKSLKAVRWYFEGNLLKKLPNCSRNVFAKKLCNIKPNKLLLETVGRSFHGNFSCEGRNDAGWGPISSNTTLIVHYKPGPASISYQPVKVIKKGQLNITCSVKDLGRPKAIYFKWFRGVLRLSEEYQFIYRVKNARLENVENFTCLAYNEVGDGDSATTFVNIEAPPAFIQKLPKFAGFVYNATSVSLNCHVECSPLCNITWMKNNKTIDFTSMQQYFVQNNRVPSNVLTDDFESMNSSLVWNLSAWPSGQLDRVTDNDITFTCISTSNDVGPGVMSTVNIQVYFPPENMTISKKVVNVVVDNIPESITCNAIARPDPQYRWYRKESEIISEDAVLYFKTPFSRNSHGIYICQANNNIGSQTISTYINVQYKPECQVVKETISGKDYVICSADGNPTDYDFDWSLKSDNDTIKQLSTIINGKSYLPLDDSILIPRTYVCIANNSIGQSNSCERHVPANFPWWLKIDGDLLATIIALAVIIILIIIIVCVVIFLMCRRKHRQLKLNNQVVELEDREHSEGGPPSPTTSSSHSVILHANIRQQEPAPRWPLKPGVLVHINRTHSMRLGLTVEPRIGVGLPTLPLSSASSQTRLRNISDSMSLTGNTSSMVASVQPICRISKDFTFSGVRQAQRRHRRRNYTTECSLDRSKQYEHQQSHHDESMLTRANRIRSIFSMQLNESNTFPGISRGKTAVTYKKIVPLQHQQQSAVGLLHSKQKQINRAGNNVSCKHKKPRVEPSQRVKRSPTDSVSEGLSEPETKTFYENLPFHGIQSPPNKLLSSMFDRVAYPSTLHDYTNALHSSVTTASSLSPCSSRPISRATSLCDGVGSSSGYESSIMRSHLGPHYSDHNMPRTNSPEPKYKSFKSRRRKYHQHHHQHNTQFYSLRLCRKHFQCHNRSKPDNKLQMTRSYQLYAIPIYRTCPHKSTSNSTIATSLRSNESTLISTLLRSAKNNRENNDEVPNQQQEGEQENEEAYKIPPIPAPRTTRKTDPSEHTYQNVPSPVFPQSLPSDSKQKPFKPKFSDLDYADVDYRSYGPINYKAASIALLQNHKKLQQQHLEQDECNPQMYCVSNDSEELL